jgi:hypothetical protein
MSSTRLVLALCALALLAIGGVALMLAASDPIAPKRSDKSQQTTTRPRLNLEQVEKTIKKLAVDVVELNPAVCDSFSPSFLKSLRLSLEACKSSFTKVVPAGFAKGTPADIVYGKPSVYPQTGQGEIQLTNEGKGELTTIKLKQDASGEWLITMVYSEEVERQTYLPE